MRALCIIPLLCAFVLGLHEKSGIDDKQVKLADKNPDQSNASPTKVVDKSSNDNVENAQNTSNNTDPQATRDIGAIGQGCTLCRCGSSIKDKGNGDEGAVDEFPWHGSLFLEGKSECSSTLINNKYILTAAHCVYDLDDDEKSLLLVRFLIPNLHETNEKTIQRGIIKCHVHESYDPKTRNNDIALLELDEKIKFGLTSAIRPICLPDESDNDFKGQSGIITGHSWIKDKDDNLIWKDVNIISGEQCKYESGHLTSRHSHVHEENHMCAGTQRGESGTCCCLKDGGAPLQVLSAGTFKNRYKLAGIVSTHHDCDDDPDKPSIYTKVSNYLKWIQSYTDDACSCVL